MNPIKMLRARTGLSQSKFAERFAIPVRTLQGWERGKHVPDYVIFLLERCIAVDYEKKGVDN